MHTVICAFDDRADAQRAMDRLVERGFSRDMVHLQSRESYSGAATSDASGTSDDDDHGFFHSISRFFSDLFGTSDSSGEAGHYAEAVRRGSTVVLVDAVDEQEAERARDLMDEMGGSVDMDERVTRWRAEGWTGPDSGQTAGAAAAGVGGVDDENGRDTRSGSRMAGAGSRMADKVAGAVDRVKDAVTGDRDTTTGTARIPSDASETTVMPVVQEELKVGKRAVEKGGVRVLRRVSETPVNEMVRLREERAVVERRPADRAATDADLSEFKEGTIEIRETAEEAVVGKTARVVEEVVVGKQVEDRTERVSDTVRRTDVEVEKLAPREPSEGSETTRPAEDESARRRA